MRLIEGVVVTASLDRPRVSQLPVHRTRRSAGVAPGSGADGEAYAPLKNLGQIE